MPCDYSLLRRKIKVHYNTQDDFAKAIGIGRVTISQRLNGKSDFSQGEIKKIIEVLDIKIEEIPKYFFTVKV